MRQITFKIVLLLLNLTLSSMGAAAVFRTLVQASDLAGETSSTLCFLVIKFHSGMASIPFLTLGYR